MGTEYSVRRNGGNRIGPGLGGNALVYIGLASIAMSLFASSLCNLLPSTVNSLTTGQLPSHSGWIYRVYSLVDSWASLHLCTFTAPSSYRHSSVALSDQEYC